MGIREIARMEAARRRVSDRWRRRAWRWIVGLFLAALLLAALLLAGLAATAWGGEDRQFLLGRMRANHVRHAPGPLEQPELGTGGRGTAERLAMCR